MYPETVSRVREWVTILEQPSLRDMRVLLSAMNGGRSLSEADKAVYATALHHAVTVVTADGPLATQLVASGVTVTCIAGMLRDLVIAGHVSKQRIEDMLTGLASINEFVVGVVSPRWDDLRDYRCPGS